MSIKTMPLADFQQALKDQGVPREHMAFICPMCRTVQSAHDFIKAGAGQSFDDIEKYIGFSCIGRFTGAGEPRGKPDQKPCNWTLGGLFKAHKLEVVTPDGKSHPHFEPAEPDQAKAHMASQAEHA